MKQDIHGVFVALALLVVILVAAPAVAQSSGMLFARDRTSLTSVRQYVATEAVPRQLALPANLIVPPMYRTLVEGMLHQSATFRRQCVRIAGEPRLMVELKIGSLPTRTAVRAQTEITRLQLGGLRAVIEIFRFNDNVELIAHEIEHIIEQLDEVDLAARARQNDTGVHSLSPDANVFETTRAVRVGLNVTAEVRAFRQ